MIGEAIQEDVLRALVSQRAVRECLGLVDPPRRQRRAEL